MQELYELAKQPHETENKARILETGFTSLQNMVEADVIYETLYSQREEQISDVRYQLHQLLNALIGDVEEGANQVGGSGIWMHVETYLKILRKIHDIEQNELFEALE